MNHGRFPHQCEIENTTKVNQPYGVKDSHADQWTTAPCRIVDKSRQLDSDLITSASTTVTMMIHFPYNPDLQEGMQVRNLVWRHDEVDTNVYRLTRMKVSRLRVGASITFTLEETT